MELIFPKTKHYDFKNLNELPSIKGGGSNYFVIAVAKSGFDLYVCFCDTTRQKVFIEKTSTLNPNKHLCMEDLTFIDNEEFKKIHNFLIEKGILDG